MRSRLLAALVFCALMIAVHARASTLDVTGGTLTYVASGGVNNSARIVVISGNYFVSDSGETIALTANAIAAGWNGSGTNSVSGPQSSVTNSISINLLDGNNTLTVDFTGGNWSVAGGLSFSNSTTVSNSLTIAGGSFDTITYTPTSGHNGSVQLGSGGMIITYTGLAPLTNSGTAQAVVFNLPAGAGVLAHLEDDGTPGNNTVRLRDAGGNFETTVFTVPSISLTINLGASNTLTTDASLATDFHPQLTFNGNSTNVVHLQAALNLNAYAGAALAVAGGPTTSFESSTITTSGGQTYSGSVQVASNVTLSSTNAGTMSFGTVQSSAAPVSLTASTLNTITFNGAVGFGGFPLASLTTCCSGGGSTVINGGIITTTGAQTFNHVVSLGANTTLTSSGNGAITLGGGVTGAFNLSVNTAGMTTFAGVAGGPNPNTITTDAPGSTVLSGLIQTSGTQTFHDPVTLSGNTTLGSTSGNIVFGSTIDGAFSVGVLNGNATLNGAVGGTTPLASVSLSNVSIAGGSITTSGNQTFNNVTLLANTTLTSTASGVIQIGFNLDGAFNLTINTAGITGLNTNGATGATTPLASITTDAAGSTQLAGNVTTTGAQTYNDPVSLTQPANGSMKTFTSSAGGNITFGSSTTGSVVGITVNTSGTTTFGGFLNELSVTTDAPGTTVIKGPQVLTSGTQTFNDPVTLTGDTLFSSTGGANITFAKTVGGTFLLNASTSGVTNFAGAVSVGSVIASSAGSTTISGGSVTSTGSQTFNNPVSLAANTTFTSAGSGRLDFRNTVNGAFSLTANTAGVTNFSGVVGGMTPLTSLTTDTAGSTTITGGSIMTSGAQTYNDQVIFIALGAETFTSSGGGSIAFGGGMYGPADLTVNTAGVTMFGGAVGALGPLNTVTTDAAGTTSIGAGSIISIGAQTFNDPATLTANTTFNSNGAITFPGTLSGAFSVTKAGILGTMTLATPNTYSGGTTVNQGTLLVTNAVGSGTGTGPVTVATNATLGGTGTIAGPTTALDKAILSPGTSIGTLHLSNGLIWNGSSDGSANANFELSNIDSTSDQLAITGAFTKGTGTTYGFNFGGTGHPATYTLATFTSTNFSVSDLSFVNLAAGFDGQFVLSPTSLQFVVASSSANHFTISAPPSVQAGGAFNFLITAVDQLGHVDNSYSGTVHFTSSDGVATLPANSTLTNGNGLFSATLRTTAGNQTITATDTVTSMSGVSDPIRVIAAPASHFSVSAPASVTAGAAFNFTVMALDPFNNVDTFYFGTVHFTSTGAAATLPADSMLTNGVGTFSATLNTGGNQTIAATDTADNTIAGTSGAIVVSFTTVDLSITKSASPPPYGTLLPVTYTMTVNNAGPAAATAVTVTDVLPAGTTFSSATPSQGTCSGTATVTCTLGTLNAGSSATITLVLNLPATPGPVSNTATVSSSNPDSNPANNSSTAAIVVVSAATIPTLSPLLLLLLLAMMTLIGVMRLRD